MQYIQSSDREAQLKVTEYKESFTKDGHKSAGINTRKAFITKDLW